jgi:hypothetical protein
MSKIATSRKHWFARGMAGGFMTFAAMNALSWFWLSDGWTDLCGATRNTDSEAIGFPFEIWREGNVYGDGWMFNFPMIGLNLVVALVFAVLAGFVAVSMAPKLTRIIDEFEATSKPERPLKMTFSVRGLFAITTTIAVLLGLTQFIGVSPWLLGAIYFVGPLLLILIAMAPVGLHWEQRVVVLIGFAIVMLVGAVMVGTKMGMEFDRVLFGVFICWVPQSVLAAAIVLASSVLTTRIVIEKPGPASTE